jgi:monoamine oxidase
VAADVLVLGAGMAGLAAADRLAAAGRRVLVVEARDRVGGRMHTLASDDGAFPIEMGPEFVQGDDEGLLDLIRSAGLALEHIPERHQIGPGRAAAAYPDVRRILADLLERSADGDRPVAELVGNWQLGRPREEVRPLIQYLEGFHAADLSRMGSRSLAENERAEDEDGEAMQRVREGYGALVRSLAARLDPARVELRLGSVVRGIRWRPGQVDVELESAAGTSSGKLAALQAVVTLPLGVLQRAPGAPGALTLDPWPEDWRRQLARLNMGVAHRVTLVFDARWWASDGDDGPSFVHGADEPFPVWWTALPHHRPVLVGWVGGPRAAALTGRPPEDVRRLGIESLSSIFGRGAAELGERLRAFHFHDWAADPFAGGAYSYGGIGAIEARAALAEPVAGTLVLAGEAVAQEGRNATVHGALASGRAAAARLLQVTARG